VSLRDPDARRAVRSAVRAVLALGLIVLLYWITGKVAAGSPVLMDIARGTLIILALGEIFYGAENVTRAIEFTGPLGTSAKIGGEEPPEGGSA
jgi:hypothetical protein